MSATLSEGLTTRPPTFDDLQSVHSLSLAYDLEQFGVEEMTLDDLRNWWSASSVHLAEEALLVFDRMERLVGVLFLENIQYVKYFAWIRIQADDTDAHLLAYLLQVAEEKVRGLLERAAPGLRVSLASYVSTTNLVRREGFQRAGLAEIRRDWRMEIEMNEAPPEPHWPDGVELLPFVPGRDDRPVFEAIDAAFRDHWGYMYHPFDEWKHWSTRRAMFDPSLWFIAYADGQIAGCSLCASQASGWVDTLGVLRPWRAKGLGLALLYHSFGEFYRRGQCQVGLTVDTQNLTGATRLYHRAGMHIARESITYEKELRAGIEPSTQVLKV